MLISALYTHIPILQCSLNWALTFLQKFFKTTSCLFQSAFNFAVLTILSSPFMIHSEIQVLSECVFFQLPVLMEAWLFPNSSASSAVPQLLVFVSRNPFTSLYAISSLFCQNLNSLEMRVTQLLCIVHLCFSHLLVSCALTFTHLFLLPWIFPRNMKSVFFDHRYPVCRIALVWTRNIYICFKLWEKVWS